MKEGDSDPVVITVTIAKADVVNVIAPVAAAAITRGGEVPADASGAASAGEDAIEGGEEPAYAAGEEPDVVVFEDLS